MKRHMGIINIVVYFFMQLFFGIGLMSLLVITRGVSLEEATQRLMTMDFLAMITIPTLLIILTINYKVIKEKISYSFEHISQTLAFGFGGYAIFFFFNIIYALILTMTNAEVANPENEEIVQNLINNSSFIASLLLIGIITPFLEEVIFRTSFFALFREDERMKNWLPYILCGLVFALIHDQTIITNFGSESMINFFAYLPASLTLAFVYRFSNHNLLAVTIMHILNNSLPLILMGVI